VLLRNGFKPLAAHDFPIEISRYAPFWAKPGINGTTLAIERQPLEARFAPSCSAADHNAGS
jgi:hypothetical protein